MFICIYLEADICNISQQILTLKCIAIVQPWTATPNMIKNRINAKILTGPTFFDMTLGKETLAS